MTLYHTVCCLIAAILLQSNVRGNIAATMSAQSHSIVEIPEVCTTLACNESAIQILSNIDENVDPCDNFYKFSCGGFMNKSIIPDSQSSVGVFSKMDNQILQQLKSIIEESHSPDELRYIKLIKSFYKSCMNEAAIEKRGLEPLRKKLKDLGGWPILEGEQWNENDFDWLESSYEFHMTGFSNGYFMSFGIDTDIKNSSKQVLKIGEPSLGLSRDWLIKGMNNTKVKAYRKLMVDVAVILGVPINDAIVELEESLKFEIELAKLPKPESHNLTQFYNPMTIKELSEKYPRVLWKKYINKILAPHVVIDDNEIVIVTVPEFIEKCISLMNVTPKRIQANYAMWRFITATARYFNKMITTRLSKYEMELMGTVKPQPRWKKCVRQVSSFIAVHSMFVRKYFNPAAKNNSIGIVSAIMDQLKKTLQLVDWMDDETRSNALAKAAAVSSYVGYPDQLLNHTLLEKMYENLDFYDHSYFENALTVARHIMNDTCSNFRNPIDSTGWDQHATTAIVNAFYSPTANSIELPAGILQGAFFNEDRPRYMNYGAIGAVIGHEITHAFDDEGRQFDKRGNVKSWWTSTTDAKYHQKVKCIINQYSNYTVEEVGKKLDGFNTQGENIADNGGFKIAYLAYKNWSEEHGKEQTLPGLKYNPQQMFWLSATNVWCSKSRTESLENAIANDPHSPDEFRILGSFRNLPEFAADFNCPIGSKMNPKNKCTFW